MALTPELKSQVQELWNRFWSSGIANPLTAIEQISYLIFLKRIQQLDDAERDRARGTGIEHRSRFAYHPEYRWSALRQLPQEQMFALVRDEVFPWMKALAAEGDAFSDAMRDAVFVLPKPSLLAEAVALVDRLPFASEDFDTHGDIYEELLKELQLSGKNGQFRTPRHVVRAMVELVDPQLGERVCDPAAGTGSFLVGAWQWVLKQHTREVEPPDEDGFWHNLSGELLEDGEETADHLAGRNHVGFDFDTTMVRLGVMNMMLHGIRNPQLRYRDTLARASGKLPSCDVILANPPFTGSIDREQLDTSLFTLQTGKTELLFVELCLALLRPGGRAAIIVPEGVLFGTTNPHLELRRKLVEENELEAVISLPSGVFRPYTGVKTAILVLRRDARTDDVLFYVVTGDGYTLNDKREAMRESNDLRYAAAALRRHRDPREPMAPDAAAAIEAQAFVVPRAELRADHALVAGMYRPIGEDDAHVGERSVDILARIRELERIIGDGLDELQALVAPSSR